MKPARIVLDRPVQLEKSWCWRDDWVTGFDSAYGLLSKFGKLNALGARELAHLFIDRGCGRRTAIVRAPMVDLRSGSFFDLAERFAALVSPLRERRLSLASVSTRPARHLPGSRSDNTITLPEMSGTDTVPAPAGGVRGTILLPVLQSRFGAGAALP